MSDPYRPTASSSYSSPPPGIGLKLEEDEIEFWERIYVAVSGRDVPIRASPYPRIGVPPSYYPDLPHPAMEADQAVLLRRERVSRSKEK